MLDKETVTEFERAHGALETPLDIAMRIPGDRARKDLTMRVMLVDLDGTLVDPAKGVIRGCRVALSALGRPIREAEDLRWIIGPPLRKSFAQLLGNDDRVEEALAHYRAFYDDRGIFEATLYEAIHTTLSTLKSDGRRLLVCTSKPRLFAQRVVEHFRLLPFFDKVYGAELDGRFEDKSDLIGHIVAHEGLAADRLCMIGDRKYDILAARRHELKSVGVLWGYGSRDELVAAGATTLCEHPGALARTVADLFP